MCPGSLAGIKLQNVVVVLSFQRAPCDQDSVVDADPPEVGPGRGELSCEEPGGGVVPQYLRGGDVLVVIVSPRYQEGLQHVSESHHSSLCTDQAALLRLVLPTGVVTPPSLQAGQLLLVALLGVEGDPGEGVHCTLYTVHYGSTW